MGGQKKKRVRRQHATSSRKSNFYTYQIIFTFIVYQMQKKKKTFNQPKQSKDF